MPLQQLKLNSGYIIVVFLPKNCGPKAISSQMSKSQCQTLMLSSSNTTSILPTILQVKGPKILPVRKQLTSCSVDVGDLVYLYSNRNKSKACDHYLFISVEGDWCNIRKSSDAELRCNSCHVKHTECYKVLFDLPTLPDSAMIVTLLMKMTPNNLLPMLLWSYL